MFSFLPDALSKAETRFPVRNALADPDGAAIKQLTGDARGWLDTWKQFLLACEQTGRYEDIAQQLLTDHLQQVLTPAKLQTFMESVFDAVGHVYAIETFIPAGAQAISAGAAIGSVVMAAPGAGPRNVWRSSVVFSKNGYGATRVTFECTFGLTDNRLHGLARVSRPEPVPYRTAADAKTQLDLLTYEWRRFLALCEGNEYERAVSLHFTDALGKVLPAPQLRDFFGSFFRELGGVRHATPFVRVSADGSPLPAPAASAAESSRPSMPPAASSSSLTLPPLAHTPTPTQTQMADGGNGLDGKHHSRAPSKSYNGDPSQQQLQRPATGNSTPGTVPISSYQSTVTFAQGVFASWHVTFEVGFYHDRISAVRSTTAAEVQPIADMSRPDLLVAYQRVFTRFMDLCCERDDFGTASSQCLSPPLAKHLPPAKLAEFMSFLKVCGRVTRVGAVQPHPVHPTANNRNSFVCTVQLARGSFGRWTVTFELAFWRDRISLLGCPAGLQPAALTDAEREAQRSAWNDVWDKFVRCCAAKTYDAAVASYFTPAFAQNLPALELRAFMNPFWEYGRVVSISPLRARNVADTKANASGASAGGASAGAGGGGSEPAAVAQSFASTVTIASDAFAKFEVEFVLYFWVDRINGLVCPKGLVEAPLSNDESATQLSGLFTVWSAFLDLCQSGKYRDAHATHFTEPMREHMAEEKLHDWFGGFFRLYGSVKAVGAVEPVVSSAAAAMAAANGGGQHQQLYTSLVIFQKGVYAKWFVTFDLAFWRDKINALYCQKPPEMCHLTNDEREKQLHALHELWTVFLALCEQKRWADAVNNHFSENLRLAVTPQRLETFYTAITTRCGAMQPLVGQLQPQPGAEGDGSNGQAYSSRVTYAQPDFVAKSQLVFQLAFWGDKLNGFNSSGAAQAVALDEHERALQQSALSKVWRSVLELAAAGEYAEAVSRHFLTSTSSSPATPAGASFAAAAGGIDPHRLHMLLSPLLERGGTLRSVGKVARVKRVRKADSSNDGGGSGSGGGSGAPSPKAGGGSDDDEQDALDAPSLYRSTVVFGRSAFHRWSATFDVHFWRDKVCGVSTPGGLEFLAPLLPAPNADGITAAVRRYVMRFASNSGVTRSSFSARGAVGSAVAMSAAALAAPRRVRLVQSVACPPGHDFIIAQPLPVPHPSFRDLHVQFIAGGSGNALSPGVGGRRNSLTLRVAGTRLGVEIVTPPTVVGAAVTTHKREVSYMRVTHPAAAKTALELSVCLEFVYTPRAVEDANELPALVQASPSFGGSEIPGAAPVPGTKFVSPFMPAFAPSPSNAAAAAGAGAGGAVGSGAMSSPKSKPQHNAFNFSVDSSAGDTMGPPLSPSAAGSPRAAAGASGGGKAHFPTPFDTANHGSIMAGGSGGGNMAPRLISRESTDLTVAPANAPVPPLALSAADAALYTAPTRDYSFTSPDAQQYLAANGLLRHTKAGGGGKAAETVLEFGFRVWQWLALNWKVDESSVSAHTRNLAGLGFAAGIKACGNVTDGGGIALVFVSVMRASGIPARRVTGLWCDPTDSTTDIKAAAPATATASGGGKYPARAEFFSDELRNWVPLQPAATKSAGASAAHAMAGAAAPFGLDAMPFALLPMHFDRPATTPLAAAAAGAGGGAAAAAAAPGVQSQAHWVSDWSGGCNLNDGGRATSVHGRLPVDGGGVGTAGLWVVPVKLGLFSTDLLVRDWKVIVT